ncbi:MAG: hypothetical protein AVDCRST_MAG21-1467, partial [uncultured Nocardioidaceae bacterium]
DIAARARADRRPPANRARRPLVFRLRPAEPDRTEAPVLRGGRHRPCLGALDAAPGASGVRGDRPRRPHHDRPGRGDGLGDLPSRALGRHGHDQRPVPQAGRDRRADPCRRLGRQGGWTQDRRRRRAPPRVRRPPPSRGHRHLHPCPRGAGHRLAGPVCGDCTDRGL